MKAMASERKRTYPIAPSLPNVPPIVVQGTSAPTEPFGLAVCTKYTAVHEDVDFYDGSLYDTAISIDIGYREQK
jgi:hypothetical protein